jgi:hypothetical protein
MSGGNMEAFYAEEGTMPKSQMLVNAHPDVSRVVWKYGRWHHHVDYSSFENMPLIKDPNYKPLAENPYKMKMIDDKSISDYERSK